MALFILFCDVTAELTNQELRFGLKIPLVVIANGAQNSNLSKIFGSLLFSYRMGPLGYMSKVDAAYKMPPPTSPPKKARKVSDAQLDQ